MKVLVTGASGFVGHHTIQALLDAGHEVRGLARREPTGDRRKAGAEYVDHVNVADAVTLTQRMFSGIDAIVHLVGIIQEARGGQTFQRVHVDGTLNVISTARDASFKGRILYMSAIGASDSSPSEYSRTKAAAERLIAGSNLRWTILRPSLILGKDGEFVEQMSDLIRYGGLPVHIPFPFIPVPGSGKNKFQPIYIDDLTRCVVRALADPVTDYKVHEIGGASQITFNALLDGFARGLGVQKPKLHAPMPLLKVAATVMEKVMAKPPVTRDQLANLGRDNITNSRAIRDIFEVDPLTFEEILQRIFPKGK
jgi:uncharacterized protein YbjT (DUF2867 family)